MDAAAQKGAQSIPRWPKAGLLLRGKQWKVFRFFYEFLHSYSS
jgi:hypothetical protein